MKRNVIQLAGKTLVISLPKKWVDKNQVKKGDQLEIDEDESGLLIRQTANKFKLKKASIDISDKIEMGKRILGTLYKGGFSEIEIKYNNLKEYETIVDITNKEYTGFDIISQKGNTCVLKEVSKITEEEYSQMFRRAFHLVGDMSKEMQTAISSKNTEMINILILRDRQVNKISDYCRRKLNMFDVHNNLEITTEYFIIEHLEKVGDLIRDLGKLSLEEKWDLNLFKIFSGINEFYDLMHETLFNFSYEKMEKVGIKKKHLTQEIVELYSEKTNVRVLSYLEQLKNSIWDFNGAILIKNSKEAMI